MDIVLITAHDLGRHLHCYGVKTVISPNLDRLASEGVRFDRAFATAPQCSPSRASIATGLYPHVNGVMGLAHHGFDWELGPGISHAAQLFSGLGFSTHLFGLQHVTLHPDRLGFEGMHASPSDEVKAHGSRVATAVEQFLADEPGNRPLYLEINVEETHRPYDYGPGGDASIPATIPTYVPDGAAAEEEFAALQGSIKALDDTVGRILTALDRAGRAASTLLIFTTDHGLAMPRAKCTLYDPGIEVALIVRWPEGGISGGMVFSELISNIDLLPTLIEAAGGAPDPRMQGRSFLPLLANQGYAARERVFAEKTYHSYYDPMRCIRTPRHKYIRNFETGFAVDVPGDAQQGAIFRSDPSRYSTDRSAIVEFYDLERDPAEEQNLAGRKELKTVEGELDRELWRWMEETGDPLLKGPIASPRYRLALANRR